MRNDREFTLVEPQVLIAQLDQQPAFDHQKELVFRVVMMPDTLRFDLHEFNVRIVNLADKLWFPIIVEPGEFLSQVNFLDHGLLLMGFKILHLFSSSLCSAWPRLAKDERRKSEPPANHEKCFLSPTKCKLY